MRRNNLRIRLPFSTSPLSLSLSFLSLSSLFLSLRNYLDPKCSSLQRNLARKSSALVQPRKRLIFGDEFIRKDIQSFLRVKFNESFKIINLNIIDSSIKLPLLFHDSSSSLSIFSISIKLNGFSINYSQLIHLILRRGAFFLNGD